MMPNPSGANGLFVPEPAYGDVKTQKALQSSAPLSGAPVATRATEAPRRARRAATRPAQPPVEGEAPVMSQLPAPPYTQTLARLTGVLATEPGAGQNLQWLAAMAGRQAQPGGPPFQGH